jgi:hypothetical protein
MSDHDHHPHHPAGETEGSDFRLPLIFRRPLAPLVRIVCPPEAATFGIAGEVLDGTERVLSAFPAHVRAALMAGLLTFENGARVFPGSGGQPFSRAPAEVQERYFASWWHSSFGLFHQLAKTLKMLLSLAYWDHPRVRQSLDYDQTIWIREVAARRQALHAEAIASHQQLLLRPDPLGASKRSHS